METIDIQELTNIWQYISEKTQKITNTLAGADTPPKQIHELINSINKLSGIINEIALKIDSNFSSLTFAYQKINNCIARIEQLEKNQSTGSS